MTVKNIKEWEERVRKAMEPPTTQVGSPFAPGINRIRETARQRKPMPTRQQQPIVR